MTNKFIKDIDEAMLSRLIDGNDAFLNDYLEDSGYDIKVIDEISVKKFKQFKFTLNGKLRLEKDKMLLKQVSTMFVDAIERNLDKPISYLNQLIQRNELAIRYRNLDKLNEQEVKNIIRDQNLLEILEMLEQEYE